MIRNYLTIALRNLWRNKGYAFVNIGGLAVGMTACFLMLLYTGDELSYHTFFPHHERIYRVNVKSHYQDREENRSATVAVPVGPAIAASIPEVEAVTRLFRRAGSMATLPPMGKSTRLFQERRLMFVDSTFFRVFGIPLQKGNRAEALKAPGSLIISDEIARKYFGEADPLGQTLRFENQIDFRVTGVFVKLPTNTDITYDFLADFETLFRAENPGVADFMRKDWLYNPTSTFVLLRPQTSMAGVDAKLKTILQRSGDERVARYNTLFLQPLDRIHLYSGDLLGPLSTGNITYLYIFGAVALMTLLIACFNFINLATVHSLRRAREVGMRKVLGAKPWQLVGQFLGESLLVSLLAFILAWCLTILALPLVNSLMDKQLSVRILQGYWWVGWTAVFVFAGLAAGTYPALFVSRFQPVVSLKGSAQGTGRGRLLRNGLVVAQFSISLVLLISAAIIYQQLRYLRSKPLGFQKEHVVVVPIFGSDASDRLSNGVDGPMRTRMNGFEEAVSQLASVSSITALSGMPGEGYIRSLVVPEGKTEQDNLFVSWLSVDYDFLPSLGIPLVAGRNFSKATGTDHLEAYILNETAVRQFGYPTPASAIGKPIQRGGEGGKKGKIIGVVKDFYFNQLDQPMEPLIIDVSVSRFTEFAVRVEAGNLPATLAHLEKQWRRFFPERVFEYSFLEDDINALYRSQEQLSQRVAYFSGLAIGISCLGLFGLAAFVTLQRTREIGIRKVLGASVSHIVALLSRDFLQLVLLANVIAWPLAYYVMNRWLQDFAYRININGWVFAAAGATAFLIALFTVSFQAIKAALANPVKSLRTE